MTEREMASVRGKEIALVLQSPISSLNPALRLGAQLEEAWNAHIRSTREERGRAISKALEDVNLPTDRQFLGKYPAQLSVGQAQRVLIAMAILHRPRLLIADEPTSALDVITQSEILELFASLSKSLGMGVLFISHDLLSIATIATRVAVMTDGEIVECRDREGLFLRPMHPYTRKLLAALPLRTSVVRASA
jgi:ABC-type dipeptide/oligopeptide/nickel transport system ATPase component